MNVVLTPSHTYVDLDSGREYPAVSRIIHRAGLRALPYGAQPGERGKRADDMRKGMQRGTEVHRLARSIDETGSLEDAMFSDVFDAADLSESNINYVAAYESFLATSGYKPTSWEVVVAHPVLGYAGKLDGIGWLGTQRILIDRKSGSVDKSVWVQLTAYRVAHEFLHPQERIDATYAVLLRADQTFSLIKNPLPDGEAEAYWTAAIWISRWHEAAL